MREKRGGDGVGGSMSSSFMFTEFEAIMMPIYHCKGSRIVRRENMWRVRIYTGAVME